jgi:hypothetical protein
MVDIGAVFHPTHLFLLSVSSEKEAIMNHESVEGHAAVFKAGHALSRQRTSQRSIMMSKEL